MIRKSPRLKKFWHQLMPVTLVAIILGVMVVSPVQANVAQTVSVSCYIDPAIAEVGSTTTLYVNLTVPPTTAGTNAYDIEIGFPNTGAVTFLESAPRVGEYPWNNTFPISGENIIDNSTGRIYAAGLKKDATTPFYGTANLFSAPLQVNQEGATNFTFIDIDIVRMDNFEYYTVDVHPCTVTGGINYPVYLPVMSR